MTSNGQVSQNMVTEFVPTTGSWSTLNVYSQNPPHRTDFCMAANDDGSKVVVFGGKLDNGAYARDLWVLDSEPRISTTCTVAGTTFVSWGGSNGQQTVDGTAILYDLSSNQYISSYTPPPTYVNIARSISGLGSNDRNGRGGPQHSSIYSPYYDVDVDGGRPELPSEEKYISVVQSQT
ncbi:hypothetical protein BGX27_004527 [Mortierella sp. AM989]|nr:hypothetical protein BGX27_004527 [Mortierella sp. AM989]